MFGHLPPSQPATQPPTDYFHNSYTFTLPGKFQLSEQLSEELSEKTDDGAGLEKCKLTVMVAIVMQMEKTCIYAHAYVNIPYQEQIAAVLHRRLNLRTWT